MELNRVRRVDDLVTLRTALISVADKSGLERFVKELWDQVPELMIYSTGGTHSLLARIADSLGTGEQLRTVSTLTGQPEMQGGLVKTLDYRIYLGLLSESYNQAHRHDLESAAAPRIDMVVCNLYPFESAAAREDATIEDLRAHIDIGGPTMIRAAAKNFLRVATVCRPEQYTDAVTELTANGGRTRLAWRARFAAAAYRYTAHYEAAIAGAFGSYVRSTTPAAVYEVNAHE